MKLQPMENLINPTINDAKAVVLYFNDLIAGQCRVDAPPVDVGATLLVDITGHYIEVMGKIVWSSEDDDRPNKYNEDPDVPDEPIELFCHVAQKVDGMFTYISTLHRNL